MLFAAAIFALLFTISLLAICLVAVLLPTAYLTNERSPFWPDKPPLVRWLGIIAKNLLGLLLIAIGAVLAIPGIPGQGLLTILIGLLLLDIPGKHRLVQNLLRRPRLLKAINRLRAWFSRPPLIVD